MNTCIALANDDLREAASKGDLVTVERLLKSGANAKSADGGGNTALMSAASKGNTAIVKALLAAGADANAKMSSDFNLGQTALMYATWFGDNHETVRALIDAKADLEAKDKDGRTALWFAADKGQTQCVRLLIAAGAEVDARDNEGATPLITGAAFPDVAKLLLDAKADVNAKSDDDETPLHEAVNRNKLEAVKLLLASGADVNAPQKLMFGINQATPLMMAAHGGMLDIMKLLLDAGADPNRRSGAGQTALSIARTDEAKSLLLALPGFQRPSPEEDLFSAIEKGDLAAVRRLLDAGVSVNATNRQGQTALFIAVQDTPVIKGGALTVSSVGGAQVSGQSVSTTPQKMPIAQLLLDHKADVNAKDKDGNTPLFETGSAEMTRLLVGKGADVNAKNTAGETALHAALGMVWSYGAASEAFGDNSYMGPVVALVEMGADINAKDKKGQTPLDHLLKGFSLAPPKGGVENHPAMRLMTSKGAKHGDPPKETGYTFQDMTNPAIQLIPSWKQADTVADNTQTPLTLEYKKMAIDAPDKVLVGYEFEGQQRRAKSAADIAVLAQPTSNLPLDEITKSVKLANAMKLFGAGEPSEVVVIRLALYTLLESGSGEPPTYGQQLSNVVTIRLRTRD